MIASTPPFLVALLSSISGAASSHETAREESIAHVNAPVQEPVAIELDTVDPGAYGVRANEFLISLSGAYSYENLSDSKVESVRLEVSAGYFMTTTHEIGARLQFAYDTTSYDEGGGATNDALRLTPYFNWNWELSPRLDVFAGPHVELFSFDGEGQGRENDIGFGGQFGGRYWIQPGVALTVEPRFTFRDGGEEQFITYFGMSFVL